MRRPLRRSCYLPDSANVRAHESPHLSELSRGVHLRRRVRLAGRWPEVVGVVPSHNLRAVRLGLSGLSRWQGPCSAGACRCFDTCAPDDRARVDWFAYSPHLVGIPASGASVFPRVRASVGAADLVSCDWSCRYGRYHRADQTGQGGSGG